MLEPDAGLELSGFGQGAQDGLIDSADSLTWTSDLDGGLGPGDLVIPPGSLSEGVHTLTLTVVDSTGLAGAASIRVGVGVEVPPVHTVDLPLGWTIAAWTGSTAVQDTIASVDGAIAALSTFNATTDSFLRFGPGAPAAANTLQELELGDGVMVLVTDPQGATWEQPLFDAARSVGLEEGPNLVAWTGPNGTPIEQALAGIVDSLLAAFIWDTESQSYLVFDTRLPASLNTTSVIDDAQGVWLIISEGRPGGSRR